VASSPLDAIWKPRPKAAQAQIAVQDIKYAGKTHGEKRQMIASQLKEMGQDVLVLTQPDSIAWLLNIRGGDVPYNPFALSFALLRADASVDLYIDPWKLTAEVRQYFGNQIATHAPADFLPALAQLGGKKVSVDAGMTAQKIVDALRDVNAQITFAEDPCQLPKACKNETEIKGMRTAHRRDGVALTRFLYWMAQQKPAKLSEMIAAEMLEEIRGEYELFRGLSFPTIAGFGSNGAIVHYHANEKTNKKFKPNHLFLLDSGAQYQDGTTDVTRTIAIGKPTSEQRDRFTRVLKGHIALASAKFPRGTTGSQLDMLARQPLWEVGLDYDHGTGHGVGCYLSVHEGPQRISKIGNRVALQPGMVISNEPGYYKTGAYGIRIENLILVRPSKIKEYLEFETLTLAPIDRKLIDAKLLTKAEKTWINAYHARVYKELAKGMDRKEKAWLKAQTKKIS
jgi:Xaa-Pro aminopeptidase